MNNSRRIGTLIRAVASQLFLKNSAAPFSAITVRAPGLHNNSETNKYAVTKEEENDDSAVYRRKLRFQRPATIRRDPLLVNNVSLIGHVAMPLKTCKTTAGFGVYTVLSVTPNGSASSSPKVLLKMWNDLAKMCNEHVKQDDFIYVSGRLRCFTKDDGCGNAMSEYEVIVNELYYVAQPDQFRNCLKPGESNPKRADPGLTGFEGRKNSIYLWQVFFSNPWEWWDNRKKKKNVRAPDFKHKDTGECLWIDHRNPPWVKGQLELLDSKMAEQCQIKGAGSRYRVSLWEYDE